MVFIYILIIILLIIIKIITVSKAHNAVIQNFFSQHLIDRLKNTSVVNINQQSYWNRHRQIMSQSNNISLQSMLSNMRKYYRELLGGKPCLSYYKERLINNFVSHYLKNIWDCYQQFYSNLNKNYFFKNIGKISFRQHLFKKNFQSIALICAVVSTDLRASHGNNAHFEGDNHIIKLSPVVPVDQRYMTHQILDADDLSAVNNNDWREIDGQLTNTRVFEENILGILYKITKEPDRFQTLNLANCGLDDGEYCEIFHNQFINWLKWNKTLKNLDLSGNSLNEVAFRYISVLASNNCLEVLKLNNTIKQDCAVPELVYIALKWNKTLKELELENNHIDDINLILYALDKNFFITKFKMNNCTKLTWSAHIYINRHIQRNEKISKERNLKKQLIAEAKRWNQEEAERNDLYDALCSKLEPYVEQQAIADQSYSPLRRIYHAESPLVSDEIQPLFDGEE